MKVIVFGPNGMLGRYIVVYLRQQNYEVIPIDRQMFDVATSNLLDLDQLFKKYNCDNETVIINCIGIIPQKIPLSDTSLFIRVNAEFPQLLTSLSEKYECKFIHITTDCVYDGANGMYCETDPHTETNIYGVSKSLGEPAYATVIRTSIIGEEMTGKKSLLEWVISKNGTSILGYNNHLWNGVTCLQLAKIIDHVIQNSLYWSGVRHIYSPCMVSKYDLVKIIIDTYQLNIDVTRHNTEHMCNKTLTTMYETNSLFNIPDLREQITEQKNFDIKNNTS